MNSSVSQGVLDSRGEQPARLLGQAQTGQQADDQVQDEEQQVGEPPAGTNKRQKKQVEKVHFSSVFDWSGVSHHCLSVTIALYF